MNRLERLQDLKVKIEDLLKNIQEVRSLELSLEEVEAEFREDYDQDIIDARQVIKIGQTKLLIPRHYILNRLNERMEVLEKKVAVQNDQLNEIMTLKK
jgi:hypothetical protein